jgi:hypothetical protein
MMRKEVGNVTKCLAAGFDHGVLISERQELLGAAQAQFDSIDPRAHFLLPEAFIAFLDGAYTANLLSQQIRKLENREARETKGLVTSRLSGKKLLSTDQAENYTGLSKQTLPNRRTSGKGPPFVRLGRSIYYELEVLDAWIAERRRCSTSDPGADPEED